MSRPHNDSQVAERVQAQGVHARLGGYLLGIWGLPCPVVEAVAHHHFPSTVAPSTFDALGAVHVSNILVHCAAANDDLARGRAFAELDHAYLERVGVTSSVPLWNELAINTVAEKT
jgi:HD-like signal output (HDOD) protein